MPSTMNMAWYVKYRPKTLNDLVLTDRWEERFKRYVEGNDLWPLLLSGGSGKGKTATGMVVLKAVTKGIRENRFIYGSDVHPPMDSRNLKALSDTLAGGFSSGTRCVFIDEVHELPRRVQEELCGVINRNYEDTLFIAATNYPTKLLPALLSRFSEDFDFDAFVPPLEKCRDRIQDILTAENRTLNEDKLLELIQAHSSDWRTLLRQVEVASSQSTAGNR